MDPDINAKSQGQMGVFAGLLNLQSRLSPEEFQLFCDNTKDGPDLWAAFALRLKLPKTPSGYSFADFAQEILQGLKKT